MMQSSSRLFKKCRADVGTLSSFSLKKLSNSEKIRFSNCERLKQND